MATTEETISQSYLPCGKMWFNSPAVTLSLAAFAQRQQVTEQEQTIHANKELIEKLTEEKESLTADLKPFYEYRAWFRKTTAEIQKKIDVVKSEKCMTLKEDEEKAARIERMKANLNACQLKYNETGTAAYIKQQEKILKECDAKIEELKQSNEQQEADLNSLRSALIQAEENLARKKAVLVALAAKNIVDITTSLTAEQMQTLKG